MDQVKFYNSQNIPLPALIPRATTQELRDELLIRQLNIAFNEGREFEKDTMALTGAKEVAKVVNDDKVTKPSTVTVSIELPEPPDGYGEPYWGEVKYETDKYLSCRDTWDIVGSSVFRGRVWVSHRIHKFPANAVGTFYPNACRWHFTDGEVNGINGHSWESANCCVVPATVFSDFVPPPDRRPYRVVNGVEVKHGAK